MEESSPVSSDWLRRKQGLKAGLNFKLDDVQESGECGRESGVGEWGLVERRLGRVDRVGGKSQAQNVRSDKGEKRGVDVRVDPHLGRISKAESLLLTSSYLPSQEDRR